MEVPELELHGLSQDSTDIDVNRHDLSVEEKAKLTNVVNRFPSEEGLGKANLISHSIEVGMVKSIKHRHFPISPAVIYAEIDRRLQ